MGLAVKRASNPILLWLIREKQDRYDAAYVAEDVDRCRTSAVVLQVLEAVLAVCRWLDAEDEWVEHLPVTDDRQHFQNPEDTTRYLAWVHEREARMAEAGVLDG